MVPIDPNITPLLEDHGSQDHSAETDAIHRRKQSMMKKPTMEDLAESIPSGWIGVVGGIITNMDVVHGGIIDQNAAGLGWFYIPNMNGLASQEGFGSRQEAFAALEKAVEKKLSEAEGRA